MDQRFIDYWMIREVDVHPLHMRKKIATCLVQHAEQTAKSAERPNDAIFGVALELNEASRGLLEGLGFEVLPDWRTPLEGCVLYMKRIGRAATE
jgi:hypothetical protein